MVSRLAYSRTPPGSQDMNCQRTSLDKLPSHSFHDWRAETIVARAKVRACWGLVKSVYADGIENNSGYLSMPRSHIPSSKPVLCQDNFPIYLQR